MGFYTTFERLCKEKGVTPAQVREDIGISQSTMASWKSRGLTPRYDTVRKISNYFGVSTDYLLDKEKEVVKSTSTPSGSVTINTIRLNNGDGYYEMQLDTDKMSVPELQMLINVFTRTSEEYGFGMDALAQLTEAAAKAAASLQRPTHPLPRETEGKDTTAQEPPEDNG